MFNIIAVVQLLLEVGLRVTLFSTGQSFDPAYQERYFNELYKETREYNFNYKVDEWTPTFINKGE